MSDLVGNPEDRFSHVVAHIQLPSMVRTRASDTGALHKISLIPLKFIASQFLSIAWHGHE